MNLPGKFWTAGICLVAAVSAALTPGCQRRGPSVQAAADGHVGSEICASCHAEQFAAWQDSLHSWAMRPAQGGGKTWRSAEPVLFGSDSTARFEADPGDGLHVEITGSSADSARYPAPYFLGRDHIRQYLVDVGQGRLQALPFGFDTRLEQWFDIFEDDPRNPGEFGHWQGRGMTANSECLFCHTTGYERGYRPESDGYQTTWAEMGVGCEACHGAGGDHVLAVSNQPGQQGQSSQSSKSGQSGQSSQSSQSTAPGHYKLAWDDSTMDTCASCHSLRRKLWDGFSPGGKLVDYFEPVLADEGAYGADGSLIGEAYEWGSFLHSRMHREGVTCGDCHDPHSGRLREQGNKLCLSCHEPSFGEQNHTGHTSSTKAPTCPDCHMPVRVFMGRDARRDHSFSIPDPALGSRLGLPDACTDCHAGKDQVWAAETLEEWFPDGKPGRAARLSLAEAFDLGRRGQAEAATGLLECLDQCADPARRTAAARLLGRMIDSPGVLAGLLAKADEEDPLVRAGVISALAEDAGRDRSAREALQRAAVDPIRAVRLHAAWGLRSVLLDQAPAKTADPIRAAFTEWQTSQLVEAEDPESHHALGLFHSAQEDYDAAIAAYRRAVELAPDALPSRHNLGVLLAGLGRHDEAVDHLEAVARQAPMLADAHYALGTAYGGQERWREAIGAFAQCLRADPVYPDGLRQLTLAYVGYGEPGAAAVVLEAALGHAESRRDALLAFVELSLATDNHNAARGWAEQVVGHDPALAELEVVNRALGRGDKSTQRRDGNDDEDSRP